MDQINIRRPPKRYKSSLGDLSEVDFDLENKDRNVSTRPSRPHIRRKPRRRAFSVTRLTAKLGFGFQSPRPIDKRTISSPIVDETFSITPKYPSTPPPVKLLSQPVLRPLITHAQESQLPAILKASPKQSATFVPNDGRRLIAMESAFLQPPAVGTRRRAVDQARDMQELVAERAKRSGDEAPSYDFLELIGKGAYGRVFKGVNRKSKALVAIKILDIDKVDYEEMTTKNMSETIKEINILQQLRDSKARSYVNMIEEARSVHNELWIVSEYASGGSVNTLMKPNVGKDHPGLDLKFIIPIARELALGLKYIHEAGIIHRDLKCNNILILEDGRVQLCDFGVSGMLEPTKSKRSTIVGTPYWMAPELQKEWVKDANPHSMESPNDILYGSEVDIWAYGCTIYEMATGFPPFHKTLQWELPSAGVPMLESEYPQDLRDFVAYVLQPDPKDRPSPDQIFDHALLCNSTKMYPTVLLVKLVEDYYRWEHGGGVRNSLFNPYGAQAPDPLAPELEDGEDEWTFSTSDEFENRLSRAFPPSFDISSSNFENPDAPPEVEDRFARLQATFKEESIDRGGKRLNRLFDHSQAPYRFSGVGEGSDGPPSDLILRDFNPGAPNRETVIDLDFAAPSTIEVPSIDLGDVPTLKANRIQKLLHEMDLEDEEQDRLEQNNLTKRATQDWKFPSTNEQTNRATKDWTFPTAAEETKRRTQDWTFPSLSDERKRQTRDFKIPPKNRATREWTFDAAIAEANYQAQRNSRRMTRDWKFPAEGSQKDSVRKTRDFKFPMGDLPESEESGLSDFEPNFSSSPTLPSDFDASMVQKYTGSSNSIDSYPVSDAAESPLRTSMIDLDMAMIDEYRPSSSRSVSATTDAAVSEQLNDNPFNLEDQVQLSEASNRTSYHMKSQSEPSQAIQGLFAVENLDENGRPMRQDSLPPGAHTRGISSVSQLKSQPKLPSTNDNTANHVYKRSQQLMWDGWSHAAAYGLNGNESPTNSVETDNSADDEDIDVLWDNLERSTLMRSRYTSRSRRNGSRDEDGRYSDVDDGYNTDTAYDIFPHLRVSLGPHGKPLVEFPVPGGPDPEVLSGPITDVNALKQALWKSSLELRDGLRTSRDLLKAMRLEDVRPLNGSSEGSSGEGDGEGVSGRTVKLANPDR